VEQIAHKILVFLTKVGPMKKSVLLLEDGFMLEGVSFGAEGEALGEVVFNTSMTGYQEILTDPSYKGQIVTMTYPLIGNYGVNSEDVESARPWAEGFVVKERSRVCSNWRATAGLDEYLLKNKIVAIEGIDKVLASPAMAGRELIQDVTCRAGYDWPLNAAAPSVKKEFFVVTMDFGVKYNSLRLLDFSGCRVKVVNANTKAEEILALKPDGVFLSNGPGDPAVLGYAIDQIRCLLDRVPVFGICLGHQLVAHALGGKTYKLKFGHHGGNHPVMDLETRKVEITSQNHGFCVDMDSIKDRQVKLTHVNLYDKTPEGLRHKKWPVFSVQYPPEAGPGPHDAGYLFERFTTMMREFKKTRKRFHAKT
jgi:carbamoyl-phosphate synthase small subunit